MFYNSAHEYNECVSHGACSISPNVASYNEIMLNILKQLAFYIINLRDLGIRKNDLIRDIIYEIAFTDSIKDFSEEEILNSFKYFYNNLKVCQNEYKIINKERGKKTYNLPILKLPKEFKLSDLIKLGEKEFIVKNKKYSENKKYLLEILNCVIKSLSVNIIILNDYKSYSDNIADILLESLDLFNLQRISSEKIKSTIDTLCQHDLNILKEIFNKRTEKFGNISKTTVSHTTKPNKAIMVSGSNLNDLWNLLHAVSNEDIDVYTNGDLIIAHAFENFKHMKNLKGHFGNYISNTMLDFATFPGAILLTKNEFKNIEYLYRGRLFTTDIITPKGVSKLKNNDFSPIINSAKQAKGFAKGQKRDNRVIGYNIDEINKSIDKLLSKNPKKFYIIGNSKEFSNEHINLLKNLPDNCCAISFLTYKTENDNILSIDIASDYALLYNILEYILNKIPIKSENLVFLISKCDVNSLSNIINLKNSGAKNIYLADCQPFIINPAILKVFKKMYNIKTLANYIP